MKKLVIAATGASGSIYLQRLLVHLYQIEDQELEIHFVTSTYAKQVIQEELGKLEFPTPKNPQAVKLFHYDDKSMHVPFASGSQFFDAMLIMPCSMGTLARIAAGTSDNSILRAADVFLKEKRKLILVPRETPWSLIHARNVVTVLEAGATVLPANPSFYHRPQTLNEVVDTVVHRVLDHIGLPIVGIQRWQSTSSSLRP